MPDGANRFGRSAWDRGLNGYRGILQVGRRGVNVGVLLPSLIGERLQYRALRPLIPQLLIAAAALTAVLVPGQTFGQTQRTTPPRLTTAQKSIVRRFEKQLVTRRFNSKDNPGDRDTWYVIAFVDTALGAKKSYSVSGNTRTTTHALHATGGKRENDTGGSSRDEGLAIRGIREEGGQGVLRPRQS